MKKLTSILVLLMVMTLSCTKNDDDPEIKIPTDVTSIADLNGTWEFQNFYYPGTGNHTTCPAVYPETQLTFTFNGTTCTAKECGVVVAENWAVSYYPDYKKIRIEKNMITYKEFYIESYADGILVLRREMGNPENPTIPKQTLLTVKWVK
jgi:hypothetical protein